MNIKLYLVIFSHFLSNNIFAQQQSVGSNHNFQERSLFKDGIYIENKTCYSMGNNFTEISKYGNPEITCQLKTNNRVKWMSALILDSTAIDFWSFYFRCFLHKKPIGKLSTVYGSIDSSDISKLKVYFEKYTAKQGTIRKKKGNYYYYWIIDECKVRLGYSNREKGYLWIQKR